MTMPAQNNLLKAFSLCLFLFGTCPGVSAQTAGGADSIYAAVDTGLSTEALRILREGDETEKDRMIDRIIAGPQEFIPAVFYQLSETLIERGRTPEAPFWFYAGQLRARYDANRSTDVFTARVVSDLNDRYAGAIDDYMFTAKNVSKIRRVVKEMLDWDKHTPYEYDQRWIMLYALKIFEFDQDDLPPRRVLTLPESEWPRIHAETRARYWRECLDAVERYLK